MEITREALLGFAENHSVKEMAIFFGKSESTIKRRLREFGIRLRSIRYSQISDAELLEKVREILSDPHVNGEITVESKLYRAGYVVQRARIRRAISQIIPAPQRALRRVWRRDYYCRAPLSVVHLDGYHKLVKWRFVIHGGIDGFSRRIFYLGLANNNRASTVLRLFREGVYQYGLPSRIRIDKGKENLGAARYMFRRRGIHGNRVIAGRSVHNTRIERLWREVRKGCAGAFRKRFREMQNEGILNRFDETHLYCLHLCFYPLLQEAVKTFKETWDVHKHRGLRHKRPVWVFEEGLRRLSAFARARGAYFTELHQLNWRRLDRDDPVSAHRGLEAIVVPPITRPISLEQHNDLLNTIHQMNITWENSVENFQRILDYVSRRIARNSAINQDAENSD